MKVDYQVGIIGTGFGGLVAALRLKKSGEQSFVMFERAKDVGGTWRDNVYPGCACDIPSPLYSFADEQNPNWKNLFGSQPEILAYIKGVVNKNDIYRHIRFDTNIVHAQFLENSGCWQVTDAKGETVRVKILLAALGPLNRVSMPHFEGMEKFKGDIFHSAEWKSQYNLRNKKVAVIGTGASAIQIVPNIVSTVSELAIFQRTPAWIMPRFDKAYSENDQKKLKKFPFLMKCRREFHFWLIEFFGLGFIGNKAIHKFMTWSALRKLKVEVNDPEIRKKLTPDYKIGCKRILKSDDFYQVFNNQKTQLITSPIAAFTENGILTADGVEHPLDTIIYATGFHSSDLNVPIEILGKNNLSLIDVLQKNGGEFYKGMTIPGFPNFSTILGPNTGLGHNSIIHIMESQMNYIMQYIQQIQSLGENSYLDLSEDICKEYNIKIQKQFKGTVWASGCKSWYYNEQGKNTTLFPRLNVRFRNITSRFDISDYFIMFNNK